MKIIEEALAKADSDIDFNGKKLKEVTEDIKMLEGIAVRLSLGKNLLSSLPDEIAALENLKYLNLKDNQFRDFPAVLTRMKRLEILDLSRNKISNLPKDFGNLMKLKVTWQNRQCALPAYLGNMSDLRIFKCDGNPLLYPPVTIMLESDSTNHELWLGKLKEFLNQHDGPNEEQNVADEESDSDLPILQRTFKNESAIQRLNELRETELKREYQKRKELQEKISVLERKLRETQIAHEPFGDADESRYGTEELSSPSCRMEFYIRSRIMQSEQTTEHREAPNLQFEILRTLVFSFGKFIDAVENLFVYVPSTVLARQFSPTLSSLTSKTNGLLEILELSADQKTCHPPDNVWPTCLACVALIREACLQLKQSQDIVTSTIDIRIGKEAVFQLHMILTNLKSCYDYIMPRAITMPSPRLDLTYMKSDDVPLAALHGNYANTSLGASQAKHQIIIGLGQDVANMTRHALALLEITIRSQQTSRGQTYAELQANIVSLSPYLEKFARTLNSALSTTSSNSASSNSLGSQAHKKLVYETNVFLSRAAKLIHSFKSMAEQHAFSKQVIGAMHQLTRSTKTLALALKEPAAQQQLQ